jgi:HPt (histidine-containing phosphotransfer) domain-containing protein
MKGDRERCLQAGMDGYVSKPIQADKFHDAIDELAPRRARRETELSASPTAETTALRVDGAAPLPPPASGRAANSIEIDWNDALVHTGGDRDLMRTMIGVFLAESPKMLDEARQALAARDAGRLRRAGHSLKGSCGYFAAKSAYDAAFCLERLGEAGDFDSAEDALAELDGQIARLQPALEQFR